MEIWKDIVDGRLVGEYEVSDLGRVKNKKTGKIKKPTFSRNKIAGTDILKPNQYFIQTFTNRGNSVTIKLHKIVLRAFNPIPNDSKYEVHHINGDTFDNRLENLEWMTPCKHRSLNAGKKQRYIKRIRIDALTKILNKYADSITVDQILSEIG